MKDITGQRFGRLVVISRAENHITSGGYPVTMWNVRCDCGTEKVVRGSDMKKGRINSCGCLIRTDPAAKKHGETGSKLFYIYYGMKDRCNNPRNKKYEYYGGKGIAVSPEWDTFEKFRDWANKNGYQPGLTIDRIDGDKGYSPENCRWITLAEQQSHKSNSILITCDGKTKTASQWAKELGVTPAFLRSRRKAGWTDEEIITIPKGQRRKQADNV